MDMPRLEATSASPAWYKALGASLLLHAAVVGLLLALHSQQGPLQARPAPQQAALELLLVTQNPQRELSEALREAEARALEDVVDVDPGPGAPDAATDVLPAEPVVPAIDPEAVPEATPQIDPTQLAEAPEIDSVEETAEQSAEQDDTNASAISWSSGTVREMVSAYARDSREQRTEDWLSACLIHNKEHGSKECPAQQQRDYSGRKEVREAVRGAFASVARPQQQKQAMTGFIAQSKMLEPLMDGGGPLADLARERYYLNKEYIEYLTGNFDYKISNFVQASLSAHSANGNGNAHFIRNTLQPVCDPMPCIWEYTGFSIVQPEQEPEGSENEFRVSASLFGNSQ